MSLAYYNDIDPFVCVWAERLMIADEVCPGQIDRRPIQEVRPDDVKAFTQVHLFSGVLGWSLALRLAGWPDDRPIWTGSCPCQSAVQRRGTERRRRRRSPPLAGNVPPRP